MKAIRLCERRAALLITVVCLLLGIGVIAWQFTSSAGNVVAVAAPFFFSGWAFGLFLRKETI